MPKIVDHEQRRKTISAAAMKVIAERGLESTKLVDIARLAGVTTGAVTHYFSDKDTILMAALEMAYDTMFANMARVKEKDSYSFLDIIAEALPTTAESRTAMTVWLAFWSRSIAEPRVAEMQLEFHHRWQNIVAQELMRHCHRTQMQVPKDLDGICQSITAQVNGLIIRGLVDRPDWPASRLRICLRDYLQHIGITD
jgi:AcrR family transcriptional regulator